MNESPSPIHDMRIRDVLGSTVTYTSEGRKRTGRVTAIRTTYLQVVSGKNKLTHKIPYEAITHVK